MNSERRYTIAELADASAAALDALGIAARNGQVRDRPDVRTIRYYGTLGLFDPPAEMTGRTARYGARHLLQVLAVKAVQARGDSLADAQRTLVGASNEELRTAIGPGLPAALAAVPEIPAAAPAPVPSPASAPAPAPAAPKGTDARRPAGQPFWRTPPAAPAAPTAPSVPAGPAPTPPSEIPESSPGPPAQAPVDAGMQPRPFVAVPLDAGATLLIEGTTQLIEAAIDTAALHAAARPLLAYLTEAGLLPGPPNHQGATP